MKDLNGNIIEIGNTVIVPEPNGTDIHTNGFVGNVEGFRGENVLVLDGEGDTFEIEPERLEIQDED